MGSDESRRYLASLRGVGGMELRLYDLKYALGDEEDL